MSFLKLVNEQKLHKFNVETALDKIEAKFNTFHLCLHDSENIRISVWEKNQSNEDGFVLTIFDKHSHDFTLRGNCKIPEKTINKIIAEIVKD